MESFEQVVTQYTPMLYKIIASLNISTNKDEFFQIGLIGLWEAYQGFDPEKGSFMSYAYSFIKGRLLRELDHDHRRNERAPLTKDEFFQRIEDKFTSCPLEEEILLSYCRDGRLSEKQTKWVLYTFLKGFSVKEIAEIEQVTVSAVKNWKAEAMVRLRNIIVENGLY